MSSEHCLHLVTSTRRSGRDLVAVVAAAIDGGVGAVQLRDRDASAAELLSSARALGDVAAARQARLLVNDRADVAVAARADGVHLPARGLPVEVARALVLPWQLVGVSVHTVEEARAAERGGADYLVFGHVFATASHPGVRPRGATGLAAVVDAVDVPVLAIGGIDASRVGEVLGTGCAGVAVMSAILEAADPGAAAAGLRASLDAAPARPKRPFPTRGDAAARPAVAVRSSL